MLLSRGIRGSGDSCVVGPSALGGRGSSVSEKWKAEKDLLENEEI